MKVETREGSLETFKASRIKKTFERALDFMKVKNSKKIAKKLSDKLVKQIKIDYKRKNPYVEDIQDMIEETLVNEGYGKVAQVYVVYRERHV